MRNKVKWYVKERNERKLRHGLSAWMKMAEEELREVEYGQGSINEEMKIRIYELEQGPILR